MMEGAKCLLISEWSCLINCSLIAGDHRRSVISNVKLNLFKVKVKSKQYT